MLKSSLKFKRSSKAGRDRFLIYITGLIGQRGKLIVRMRSIRQRLLNFNAHFISKNIYVQVVGSHQLVTTAMSLQPSSCFLSRSFCRCSFSLVSSLYFSPSISLLSPDALPFQAPSHL